MAFIPGTNTGNLRGAAVTRNNATAFIPEMWSNEVQRERDLNFTLRKYVKMIPGEFSKGDRLNIPRISRAAVNVKLPETPVNFQSRTDTSFYVDIDRYMESSFIIEDIVNIQSKYNLRAEYGREAGYALARDIDNYLLAYRAAIHALASQRVIAASGTVGAPLNYSALLTAKLILDRNAVPDADRVLIVSPTGYNQLLAVDKFISVWYRGHQGTPVENGVVGTIFNIPVIMSTNLVANSTTGYMNGAGAAGQPTPGVANSPYFPSQDTAVALPTTWNAAGTATAGFTANAAPGGSEVHTAILCHKDWAVMAMQKTPSVESSRETPLLSDVLVYSQVYGGRVYRPDHACVIFSDGSLPAVA